MKFVLHLVLCCLLATVVTNVKSQAPLFESISPQKSGISFKNTLTESRTSNVLTYEYFYNGGGVAIGDLNNDGLDDVYFTGNMKPNALYINQGNFKFKEIAAAAGVDCKSGWKTGVTMADVNGDGFLDIYVCFSGKGDPAKRKNKLFINNGNLSFKESAASFGLDDPSYSTQASFLDYDRDGDLDMYLLNHNVVVIREFEYAKAKASRDPYAGDKLFRNDNGHFTDVSEAAGIKGNPLGFGLGINISDINKDGWLDMYVSNDYVEPDYVYINNHDGTFTDRMTEYLQHLSYFSMGCDISDINNDTWPDIFTVDMLPEDNKRQKLLYGPENYEHYALMVMNGFYFQNMRNMLHLNNANGTFSEIGQFAGISKTDWSWAPLVADYDNDGFKDLFITNGYFRDYTNRDFLKYKGDYYFQAAKEAQKADTFHLVSTMTSTPVHDYMYKNNGNNTFTDESIAWGFKDPDFSNGAAYADLDNDGDLDLVVNHQNETASVYKNNTRERNKGQHYLQLQLAASSNNSQALGAKITTHTKGKVQYFEHLTTRGFQSNVTGRVHIGLGQDEVVDTLNIVWPDQTDTTLLAVKADQLIKVIKGSSTKVKPNAPVTATMFNRVAELIKYSHVEEGYNDFKRQPLLLTMLSTCGPIMATGDINRDGLLDVFVGGAQSNPGKIFLQSSGGSFIESQSNNVFNKVYTDADALFVDVDGDKDLDLYVVSGGYNEYKENDPALQDRIYFNDGSGKFSLAVRILPEMRSSKGCVAETDFDHDGDIDLFVGGRVVPGKYPVAPESFLLKNEGGKFENATASISSDLAHMGMVTDAMWLDLNNDKWDDLVLMGEFMAIEVYLNKSGKSLERATAKFFDKPLTGLWNTMTHYDFDGDGDQDIVAGNLGLNTQLRASDNEPITMVYKDFDSNGSIDPMLTHYIQGIAYPFASRDELLDQFYGLRSKYTSYGAYADAQLSNIFAAKDIKDASTLQINTLQSVYLENRDGKFAVHALPVESQFAPIFAFELMDVNKDGKMDIVACGNQSSIRIRMGVIDANLGQIYAGDGKGDFKFLSQDKTGMRVTGDTKSLKAITVEDKQYLLIGINNVGVECYKLN
ncbi:MAG: VCBS repeat-containing protein [Chryseolinea sp.]